MKKKLRLDLLLIQQYPQYSRQTIQSFIMQGKVSVDGAVVTKSGTILADDIEIVCNLERPKYVSRAGFKLEKALDHWSIDVANLCCMDAGISTGGFSDCLLQRGAQRIYGVDVGWGQVDPHVANNERVVLLERTNLRYLAGLPEPVDLVTLDLSFISVLKVMDVVQKVLRPGGTLVVLIKPQFEARRDQVGRGGIIKNPLVHQEVIERVTNGIQECGFLSHGVIQSPITGSSGNIEFLGYFTNAGSQRDEQ
jgi:23S rRNA (cytidine1920-2'-O)/16S rRNA (cytidine1409-2'-O)-methyltransferase